MGYRPCTRRTGQAGRAGQVTSFASENFGLRITVRLAKLNRGTLHRSPLTGFSSIFRYNCEEKEDNSRYTCRVSRRDHMFCVFRRPDRRPYSTQFPFPFPFPDSPVSSSLLLAARSAESFGTISKLQTQVGQKQKNK